MKIHSQMCPASLHLEANLQVAPKNDDFSCSKDPTHIRLKMGQKAIREGPKVGSE